jgi:hypothetical protein
VVEARVVVLLLKVRRRFLNAIPSLSRRLWETGLLVGSVRSVGRVADRSGVEIGLRDHARLPVHSGDAPVVSVAGCAGVQLRAANIGSLMLTPVRVTLPSLVATSE